MFAAVVLALATTAAIAAPIAERDVPKGWAKGYLENYEVYHTRYLALNCHEQHGTTFFQDCCRPLLATENLTDNRKSYCTPNATAVVSAYKYGATASTTQSADVEAASEYNSTSTSTYIAEPAASTSAVADAQVQYADASSSTAEWVAPSTTSTYEAPAQTSEAASSGGDSPSGDVKTGGYATYFYQGGNAGACGQVHSDSDKVIAIDSNGYWSNFGSGEASSHCGKWINIKNTNNGKTVTAMVADVCPTCTNDNSLDLSVGAFTAIASESDGMVPIEWSWA